MQQLAAPSSPRRKNRADEDVATRLLLAGVGVVKLAVAGALP
jgi:hypothetical protein